MPSWSTRWSFFLILTFAIYVIARGDGPKWKALLTQPVSSGTGLTSGITSTASSGAGLG